MLSDRPYMRHDYPRPKTSVLVWLIAAIIAGFLLQSIFLRWLDMGWQFDRYFALSPEALRSGEVWTLLTYAFLHDPRHLLHIVGNLFGLYFLGRELLPTMGDRRFLGFFAGASILGGLAWVGAHWGSNGQCIGASAAVLGLLIVYASMYPNRPVTFLLFFVFPVTLKPKYVAWALLALDLFGFVFYEVLGTPSPLGMAHSAHLGGMLAGWIYYRWIHESSWHLPSRATRVELPAWMKKKQTATREPATYKVNFSDRRAVKAEVDRILDKINTAGFAALSEAEKRVLDDAKDILNRR